MKDTIKNVAGIAVSAILYTIFQYVVKVATISPLIATLAMVWFGYNLLNIILGFFKNGDGQFATVCTLVASISRYLAVLVTLFLGLSILGVDAAAILAAAGVLSLIIGFGAQSLIEDVITGIFIIFEGRYKKGDYLVLDDFRGKVIDVSVRTTTIEDMGGNRKTINNSDIRNFQNRSLNDSFAICHISIGYEQDLREFEQILTREEFARMKKEEIKLDIDGKPVVGSDGNHIEIFEEAPLYDGIEEFGDSGIVVRFRVKVKEEDVFSAQRRLNRQLKLLFDANKIIVPFPQVVIHKASN